jgi:hypothetical protein
MKSFFKFIEAGLLQGQDPALSGQQSRHRPRQAGFTYPGWTRQKNDGHISLESRTDLIKCLLEGFGSHYG